MEKNDLPTIILVAVITFFVTFAIGNFFFGSPQFDTDEVEIADPLPTELGPIDDRLRQGTNPTERIEINQGSGSQGL